MPPFGKINSASDVPADFVAGQSFPVGSVFLAAVATDPAALLGYGTWSRIAEGRVLVGQSASDPDFDAAEETGGAKTVAAAGTVSQPTFAGTPQTFTTSLIGVLAGGSMVTPNPYTPAGTVSQPTFTGTATSVVQPYFVVYVWKRTA